MLAIAGALWTTSLSSERWCMPSYKTDTEPWIVVHGVLAEAGFPCGEGEDCPTCLTIVLMTGDRTYYLTAGDNQAEQQLDAAVLGTSVTIEGIPFTREQFNYIQVSSIAAEPLRLRSLCDTWNILFVRMGGRGDEYSTEVHRLTTDTVINGKTYAQLYIYGSYGVPDMTYRGALREDENANIYIVPATADHEYLLYAFNAKVGDKLSNLWIGGSAKTGGLPDGLNARVADITETLPRIFTLYLDIDDYHPIQWIEGVGLTDEPGGSTCPAILGCGCSCGHRLLCAYKDGEQVYASEVSEQFGCWYDSNDQQAGDTVRLYVQDGPGSSTVDPIDPNQITAVVKEDQLIIHEYIGEEIEYELTRDSQGNSSSDAPAAKRAVQADSFHGAVTIKLTDQGFYTLQLTNPDWNYSIVGTFEYYPTSLQETDSSVAAKKVLHDGQMLIKHGDKIYTLTGLELR